jgi:hypothetical protein
LSLTGSREIDVHGNDTDPQMPSRGKRKEATL